MLLQLKAFFIFNFTSEKYLIFYVIKYIKSKKYWSMNYGLLFIKLQYTQI